jgi:uncharacterized membrane protein YkvA (DUF1232 family)
MKFTEQLREKAKQLKRELIAVYYACQNPKVKLLPKAIAVIALGYALSPIDLIPDFVPSRRSLSVLRLVCPAFVDPLLP